MKKSELKNIIKECVKEVIFEEGVLSGIITEVAQGLVTTSSSASSLREVARPSQVSSSRSPNERQHVLDAIGKNSYEDAKSKMPHPELFEGTQPLREHQKGHALAGTDPHDSGVDISNIPGFGTWGALVNTK